MKIRICLLVLVLALLAGAAMGQSETPTVALLSFGTSPIPYSVTEKAIVQVLELDGFLSADEYNFEERGDIEGENLHVLSLEAGWALDRLNIMVEHALDHDADVLVAFTTPVAQAALNATLDMDDPPAVIFASVYFPFEAGLGDSPCIKPGHVAGSQIIPPYELLVELIKTQQPDIETLGAIFSSDQLSGVLGAQEVAAVAGAHGIEVIEGAVTQPIDFDAAINGLASRGAQALLLTIDTVNSRNITTVVGIANEHELPVYFPSIGGAFDRAIISAGYFRHREQGVNVGRMVSAYLRGELDPATIAVASVSGDGVAVNHNAAAELGIEIAPEILERADVIFGGEFFRSERLIQSDADELALFTADDRAEQDAAFLASLECTAERIAEEQAALDAADS